MREREKKNDKYLLIRREKRGKKSIWISVFEHLTSTRIGLGMQKMRMRTFVFPDMIS